MPRRDSEPPDRTALGSSSIDVPLHALDELWFQVGGTRCNLSCHHCFISCHPGNDRFGFLDIDTIERHLEDAKALGVREYYFTGGEPFLHRGLLDILERTLAQGPTTVLTNGTVFTKKIVDRLRSLADRSRYSLELRVSIDGPDAATNDPIRGEGTFARAMAGVELLLEVGLLPILTVAQTWPDADTGRVFDEFVRTLRSRGYARPRIKILPTLHLGEEVSRSRGYDDVERVTPDMLDGYDTTRLLCSRGRIVTDRGVAVCPILIESPDAHLGDTLAEASRPFAIAHGACYTCYRYGAICSNVGGSEVVE